MLLTEQQIRDLVLDPWTEETYLDGREAPAVSGIYALWNSADQLLYIGKSVDIGLRLAQHRKQRDLTTTGIPWRYATCLPVERDTMGAIEVAHIHALTPPYNNLYELARWARHAEVVCLIAQRWTEALSAPGTELQPC